MKTRTIISFLLILLGTARIQAQPGQTGFSFLKLGVGARALAMGEAYAAIVSDPSATYYNPAGLANSSSSQLLLMHRQWLQDVRTEYFAGQSSLGSVAVAVSVNATSVNDIEIRQQAGPPQGTFDAHNAALGLSLGYKIDTSVSIGITGKYLYEKILIDESSGLAMDLGILYMTPWNIRLGASLSNLGSVNELDVEASKLPTLLRVGGSYDCPVEQIDGMLTLATDIVSSGNESTSHVNFGAELDYHRTIAFRAGYQTGYEARNFTGGLGFHYEFFQFDYAFIPGSYDLGATHTFSLGIEFR